MTSSMAKCLFPVVMVAMSLTPSLLKAHEGHDVPGALPPAPHGGVIGEAEHKTAHAHDKNEAEVFLEVKAAGGKLEIYPLLLEASNTATFKTMAATDFKVDSVKVDYPRTKKSEAVKVTPEANGFTTAFAPKSPGRFLVTVTGTHNNEVKVAKLQVEPK